ncbi:MAG: peptidoglycan DD-metalloendopeptidase family protein [Reichenbachiella sp.]|uniref:murein hydrolase activator EnvC family protein n=1 Tax=Reichenbachiella sp. TaxID=2184521 RepID=UPI003265706C
MTPCRILKWLFFATILFCTSQGLAQKSKAQIEKEKKESLAKISEVQKILKETEQEKKASIGQLQALNRQIEARRALIGSITQEINLITSEIGDLSIVVNSLQSDLEHLKEEYGQMIYDAYKANQGYGKLTFLFSAETFNQLFLRLKYLEQYTKAREIQVEQIEKVRDALDHQRSQLVVKKEEQDALLKSKINENKSLLSLKTKQSKVVQELSKREKELKAEVAETKKAVTRLDNLLAKIIKAEIEKSNAGKNANTINLTVEMARISSSFEGKRNRLPWPVQSGFVSEKFGKHPHPVLKNIWVENQGVDIQTQKNAQVKSVFEGKIATTAFVPGMNRVVIVQHGDYYTLYAKLKSVDVKKGQVIKANESLGEVFTNSDGISELQFQVWKNNVKMDPEKWLANK